MVWKIGRKKGASVALACFAVLQLVCATVHAQETGDEPAQLYAQSAVLMDADSGRILFGKNEREVRPMASTTKIMTCILALEQMEEDQTVTISDEAVGQPKVRLGVRGKEEYQLMDLLYSLMLESHNDAAVAVAEGISGSVEEFARLMNDKARELGCEDTHFVTPNGLDGEDEGGVHSTTAADLARILRYCIRESPKREEFLKITRTKSYQFSDLSGKRAFTCNNHNAFLNMMEGALTGKTGFTADAGYCYVGALKRGERTFIVALLACGWPGNKGYKWKDTRALMEYALANYDYQDVTVDTGEVQISVPNGADPDEPFRKGTQVAAAPDHPGALHILLGKEEQVEVKTELKDSLEAPVKSGDEAGVIRCLLNGEEIAHYQVVTLEAAPERTFGWCLARAVRSFAL